MFWQEDAVAEEADGIGQEVPKRKYEWSGFLRKQTGVGKKLCSSESVSKSVGEDPQGIYG